MNIDFRGELYRVIKLQTPVVVGADGGGIYEVYRYSNHTSFVISTHPEITSIIYQYNPMRSQWEQSTDRNTCNIMLEVVKIRIQLEGLCT